MKNFKRKERREAQFAILLTFLGCWAFDASICRGQAAGFAQSRQQAPISTNQFAESESGEKTAVSGGGANGFRSFVANLNPFKSGEVPLGFDAPNALPPSSPSRISFAVGGRQSVPSSEDQTALIGPPRQYGQMSGNTTHPGQVPGERTLVGVGTASRQTTVSRFGATRTTVASAPGLVGNSQKSATGGVASHLLDELAAEIGDRSSETSRVAPKRSAKIAYRDEKTVNRRSLRDAETLDELELLDSGDEYVDSDEYGEYEEYENGDDSALLSTDEIDDETADAAELDTEPAIPAYSKKVASQRKRRVQREDAREIKQETKREREVAAKENAPKKAKSSQKYAVQVEEESDENAALEERFDAILSENDVQTAETSTFDAAEESENASKTLELEPKRDANGSVWSSENAVSNGSNVVSVGAPIVEIETVGPQKLVVGQETTYTIRVRNSGKYAARKLVVSTELPETVAASDATVRQGSASIEDAPIDSISDAKRCVWKVGTLEAGAQTELTLKLTPIKRNAFELISEFEFERSAARTGVEVSEPILEARIEGRDAIERGVEDQYRLRVRNVGNGDAENVELFVSTGENEATQRLGLLKAGEEKTLEITLQTALEGSIAIAVRATGDYGLEASASKTIAILRGKLETSLETPELQFVDGEFEAVVRARNAGDASLQDVVVVAQTPTNVELLDCSGSARRNDEKRRVYWTIPLLRPNEEAVYRLQCRLTREGDATFALAGTDRSGETTQNESTVQVESIAALAMRVKTPKSPVAVGGECVYELIVENNGTKEAQAVDSGVFLGAGLKPIAVENGAGVVHEAESKVIFKQIERLPAGESVVFRVRARAVSAGNHKVQAMLQSIPEDARLLNEETTYCYDRNRSTRPNAEKTPSFVALQPSENEPQQ